MKIKSKASVIIILLLIIGFISAVLAFALITIKPLAKLAELNNTKRTNDVIRILNAVRQYSADNQGSFPPGLPAPGEAPAGISQNGADICALLVPKYLPALPSDPVILDNELNMRCSQGYDSGYAVSLDYNNEQVTISAPHTQPPAKSVISVTR